MSRILEALEEQRIDITVGRNLPPEFAYGSLPLAVADAIFSLALRYEAQCVPVVRAFAAWLDVPMDRGSASVTVRDAHTRLAMLHGDTVLTAFGGKRYRTSTRNGILKADAVRQALYVLHSHNINDFIDMRHDNPALSTAEREFARIPGQGRLTAWKYLLMLAGDEHGVKPDRHLLTFTLLALQRKRIIDEDCANILREAAYLLAEDHDWITPRRLDYAIWSHYRQRGA